GLPGAGRGVSAGGGRAVLRHPGQPGQPPGAGRAALLPGAPALGVRVPAEVRALPEPDRALVEGAAQPRAPGAALRDVGGGVRGGAGGDRLLERAPPPLRVGPPTPPPGAAPP